MKYDRTYLALQSVLALSLGLFPTAKSMAQIVPDASLPVNSIVAPDGNSFTIDGGTAANGNLFHSFQDFSLPTGSEAFFNNSLDVQNIFSRVTGGKISNIDGLIRANGTANLFLLNPNGIVFGPNARLDIGGSFLGSTADSVLFEDGSVFSATEANAPPLLTINVPVGLQMGTNPGGIEVRGMGHRLTNERFGPIGRSNNPIGLQVDSGRTLGLIGGDIRLDGGLLSATSGHIELGSTGSGTVSWDDSSLSTFDYSGVEQFGSLSLSRTALVDASGTRGGSIHLQGGRIQVGDNSTILIQNLGSHRSGDLIVRATEFLEIRGGNLPSPVINFLLVENLADGSGGNLVVSAPNLDLQNGGNITTTAFGTGRAGNIIVDASSIVIEGFLPTDPSRVSIVSSINLGSGSGGDLTISTDRLRLVDGGNISNLTLGTGNTGDIAVNVTDTIEIVGTNALVSSPSTISVSSLNRGDGGRLTLNAAQLILQDGGTVSSSTLATGNAGNTTIDVSESIEVRGVGEDGLHSSISASAQIPPLTFQQLFGLLPTPGGNTGNVIVNTPVLQVSDGATVSVAHAGTGDAGFLQINADRVFLDRSGAILAATTSGQGGDISLNVRDSLQLRQGAAINAESFGVGNGGNIAIDSDTIALLENSRITANAFQGAGGNIQISTQGLFASPDSNITASSQFGIDGVVTITNPDVDPSSSLVNFSQAPIDPAEQVVSGCQWTGDSEVVATGRGGVPANPNRPMSASRTWSDVRDLSEFRGETVESVSVRVETPQRLVEATGWVVNEAGTVELVATANPSPSGNFAVSGCNPLRSGEFPSTHRSMAVETGR